MDNISFSNVVNRIMNLHWIMLFLAVLILRYITLKLVSWRLFICHVAAMPKNMPNSLFPTCQVRVVRVYQSCSSPPPLPPPSSSSFSSATSASTSMFTSALPTLRQALRQLPHAVGTAGPQLQGSERTGHRCTSTCNRPSSVSTAGPQPGSLRAQ